MQILQFQIYKNSYKMEVDSGWRARGKVKVDSSDPSWLLPFEIIGTGEICSAIGLIVCGYQKSLLFPFVSMKTAREMPLTCALSR